MSQADTQTPDLQNKLPTDITIHDTWETTWGHQVAFTDDSIYELRTKSDGERLKCTPYREVRRYYIRTEDPSQTTSLLDTIGRWFLIIPIAAAVAAVFLFQYSADASILTACGALITILMYAMYNDGDEEETTKLRYKYDEESWRSHTFSGNVSDELTAELAQRIPAADPVKRPT